MEKEVLFSSRIQKILNFLDENYGNEITLQKAAEAIYLSKDHFNRIFKAEIGVSFKKYLRILRLFKSAMKLRTNYAISVTDICFDVGFNDLSNFIKSFKLFVGCSPIKYKLCSVNPEQCYLRKKSILFKLSFLPTLSKSLEFSLLSICYLKRARKSKK